MITLYHRARTRSTRFIFLLEELGAPYRIQRVGTRLHDGSGGPDALNPHPHGKVPAIADDGEVVFESSAIALYLTDKYPQNRLGPRAGEAGRGAYLSWLAYYTGVMEPAFMMKFMNVETPRVTAGWVPSGEVIEVLGRALADRPFLLGESFSAVDVLYGTTFAMFAGSPLLPDAPLLQAYAQRVVTRPAHARAQALDAG